MSKYVEHFVENQPKYLSMLLEDHNSVIHYENQYIFESASEVFSACADIVKVVKRDARLFQLEKLFFNDKQSRMLVIDFLCKNESTVSSMTHLNILLIGLREKWFNDNDDWLFKTLTFFFTYSGEIPKFVIEFDGKSFIVVSHINFTQTNTKLITEGDGLYSNLISYLIQLNHLLLWEVTYLVDSGLFKTDLIDPAMEKSIISFARHYPDRKVCLAILYEPSALRNTFQKFK